MFTNTIFVKCFTGFTKFILLPHRKYVFEHKDYPKDKKESKEEKLRCEDCDLTFAQSGQKYRHVKAIHGVKSLDCSECGKLFRRKDQLDRHIKSIHSSDVFKCEDCGKHFNRSDNFDRHKKGLYKNCNLCGKRLCSLKSMSRHFAVEHGLYECGDCGQTFNKICHLNEHSMYETKCDICEQSFCTKKKMLAHKKVNHAAEKFQCKKCEKEFSKKWLLMRHSRDAVESSCDECGQMFCNPRQLITHKNTTHKSM